MQDMMMAHAAHGREQVAPKTRPPVVVRHKPNSTPILLFTDIGADIDDTFALLVAAGSVRHCHLVGVVTSVNDGVLRGSIVRGWLRLLGLDDVNGGDGGDNEIPVLPTIDPAVAGCTVPSGFPTPQESNLGDVSDTPQRILDIAAAYGDQLVVAAIAPVTPLADALLLDSDGVLKNLKRIYVQGNVIVDKRTNRLKPDPQAYNFRVHMGAAERMFQELQDHVPFSVLGKYAAYEIGVQRKDLAGLDALNISHSNSSPSTAATAAAEDGSGGEEGGGTPASPPRANLLSFELMARDQMNTFRQGNFELWSKLYPVPSPHNGLDSMDWFDHLPGDVISHPYDPLLILMLAQDAFEEHCHRHHSGGGDGGCPSQGSSNGDGKGLEDSGGGDATTSSTSPLAPSSLFAMDLLTRVELGRPLNAPAVTANATAPAGGATAGTPGGGATDSSAFSASPQLPPSSSASPSPPSSWAHVAVGNSAESNGVANAEATKNALVAVMRLGVQRIQGQERRGSPDMSTN